MMIICSAVSIDDKEKDDKLSTVIQMMSEVMNKLMEVELELKQKVEDNVVKELQSRNFGSKNKRGEQLGYTG